MNVRTAIYLSKEEQKKDKEKLDFLIDGEIDKTFPKIHFNKIVYFQNNKSYCFCSRSYSKKVKLAITNEDEEVSLILFYGDYKIQCHEITNKMIYEVMCYCHVERSCAIIMLLENCLDFTSVLEYYFSNINK